MLKLAAESHARACALVTRLCGSLLCRSRCRRGAGCCSARLPWPLGHSPGTWARFSLPVQHLRGDKGHRIKSAETSSLSEGQEGAAENLASRKQWGECEPSALPVQSQHVIRFIFLQRSGNQKMSGGGRL